MADSKDTRACRVLAIVCATLCAAWGLIVWWSMPAFVDVIVNMHSEPTIVGGFLLRIGPVALASVFWALAAGLLAKEFFLRSPPLRLWLNLLATILAAALLLLYLQAMLAPLMYLLKNLRSQ